MVTSPQYATPTLVIGTIDPIPTGQPVIPGQPMMTQPPLATVVGPGNFMRAETVPVMRSAPPGIPQGFSSPPPKNASTSTQTAS